VLRTGQGAPPPPPVAPFRRYFPLRLVGANGDTEVRPADPLGLLLADLAQARLVRQHTLGPLDATQASALLKALLKGDIVRAHRGFRIAGWS
jgi:hypothetical protein